MSRSKTLNHNYNNTVDIAGVVASMKKFINQLPARDTAKEFEFLYSLISPAFIRMRFEITYANNDKTVRMMDADSANNDDDNNVVTYSRNEIRESRRGLHHGQELPAPCFAFMNAAGTKVGRVLLTQNRERSNYSYPISYEANGLVLDSSTWNVLSLPVHALKYNMSQSEIVANLHNYVIMKIADGTTVTLYYNNLDAQSPYDENLWRMSTANGYDVNDYQWMGNLTYREAFNEIAAKYPDFKLSSLDRNCSYSIGFRHRDFHPFIADKEKMWIQCVNNRTTLKQVRSDPSTNNTGLPMQSPIQPHDLLNVDINSDMTNSQIFAKLSDNNAKALDTYMNSIIPNSKHVVGSAELMRRAANVGPGSIHYGYILRGTNPLTNVILESELLKKIRQFMYNLPRGERLRELTTRGINIDHTNRVKYCVLRAFLNFEHNNLFIQLFPQFHPLYAEYTKMINDVTTRILRCFKDKKTKQRMTASTAVTTNATSSTSTSIEQPHTQLNVSTDTRSVSDLILDSIVSSLYNHIATRVQINPYEQHAKEIIHDWITTTSYTDLYFSYISHC